jgi:hypothetical protein
MLGFILTGVGSGILFGVLDGFLNANPLARRLYEVYGPIAREKVNAPVGVVIDLAYGFVLAALFLLLYKALPGRGGVAKGLCFGLILWLLRVAMSAVSQWMMFKVPAGTLAYTLCAGLAEMLILGVLYGLVLKPANG